MISGSSRQEIFSIVRRSISLSFSAGREPAGLDMGVGVLTGACRRTGMSEAGGPFDLKLPHSLLPSVVIGKRLAAMDPAAAQGLNRGLTNYGDPAFSRFL